MKKDIELFFDNESGRYTDEVLQNTEGNLYLNNFETKIVRDFLKNYLGCEKKVLDIGPGNGRFLDIYSNIFSEIFLLDISQNMLNSIKKRYNLKKASFIKSDFESHQFKEKFDLIISFRVFKYFTSIQNSIEKVCELLNPGGYAIIQVPNFYSYQLILKSIFKEKDVYFKSLNLIKVSEIQKIIPNKNCKIVSMKFGNWIPYFIISRINSKILLKTLLFIENLFGVFLYPFGRDITITMKKK